MMKTVFWLSLCAVIGSIVSILLIACAANNSTVQVEYSYAEATIPVTTAPVSYPSVQNILDNLYEKVALKDGRIYLSFGARDTLTVENFNKLILQDQLGCAKGRFTFVIDPSILTALQSDYAYGGIGFDQEWITSLKVQIRDNSNGALSEPVTLIMTLLKSKEADTLLRESTYSKSISTVNDY